MTTGTALAQTLNVTGNVGVGNYTTIQAAVSNASSGDTILVYPGNYSENLFLTMPNISIQAVSGNPEDTVICSNSENNVFDIYADDITISGFTLKDTQYSGVYLSEGVSGANIVNNNLQNNSYGIRVYESDNNNLTGNAVTNCEYGIKVSESNNNTLAGNTVTDCEEGISLISSSNNTLDNNLMQNNYINFGVTYYTGSDLGPDVSFNNDISDSNTINGKPVFYLRGVSDVEITSSSNAGIIYLINCNNVLVEDQQISNNTCAIYLYNTTGSITIKNNILTNNEGGIYLENSSGSQLLGNRVTRNLGGIVLLNSGGSTLNGNKALENSLTGILLWNSENCDLIGNTASDNVDMSMFMPGFREKGLVGASSSEIYPVPAGIALMNSPEGTLTGNTALNNSIGIYLGMSGDSTLTGNVAHNNSFGIGLEYSNGVNLIENTASSNNKPFTPIHMVSASSRALVRSSERPASSEIIRYGSENSNLMMNKALVGSSEGPDSSGIIIHGSENNSLIKNKALDSEVGIYLVETVNNSLSGNTALYNGWGIYIDSSEFNSLSGNTVSYNQKDGITLLDTANNSLSGNTALYNGGGGIYIDSSEFNSLSGNIASYNKMYEGIGIYTSVNNTLSGNTASYNEECGITLYEATNNTLSGNTISENNLSGIYFEAYNNTSLFNNYFNNRNNTEFYEESQNVTWNITKTSGKNIVGGPYLGGNYWATPNGTGWSQNCTDADKDGLCDAPYNITANFTDYLPLKVIPTPESTGGSSHAPRYIPASSGASGVQAVEYGQQRVIAGQETHITLSGENSGILGISFTSEEFSGMVVTTVEVLDADAAAGETGDEASGVAETPEGIILRYMNINVGNERFESSENLNRGVITFKVPKSWIKENNIDESTIGLNRFHDGEWNRLPSEKTGEDEEFVYFRAETPGFSLYSITGDQLKSEVIDPETKIEETSPVCGSEAQQETPEKSPGFGIALACLGLLLSVFLRKDQ
ncbi:NosD domain-containing protein [Methanosarcina sp. KYL-1]|uniref:NosD domain-containing protein n=1 Tax=Methanosarcina sp. KYL-1 TaxID=2602068 RepID=UPI0021017579|nr:NosD domain-containing protein [Methanosarcina sp. KYL-1]